MLDPTATKGHSTRVRPCGLESRAWVLAVSPGSFPLSPLPSLSLCVSLFFSLSVSHPHVHPGLNVGFPKATLTTNHTLGGLAAEIRCLTVLESEG